MNTHANWKNWLLAGVTAGALGLTTLTFAPSVSLAQSSDTTAQPAQPALPGAPMGGQRGPSGGHGFAAPLAGNHDELLADALGITAEELAAARTAAQEARLAQAVEQGLLTQEQADALQAGAATGRGPGGHFGRGFGRAIDGDELLADALGITAEELAAAQEAAAAAGLEQAVADGTITQEQADLMAAQRAFRSYTAEQAQSAYAEALAAAVEAGAITQAQADLLSAQGEVGRGGHWVR